MATRKPARGKNAAATQKFVRGMANRAAAGKIGTTTRGAKVTKGQMKRGTATIVGDG